MNQTIKSIKSIKTIVIIGGMGPQASVHAHQRLISKLKEAEKRANIIHISLEVKPFFSGTPKLNLSDKQIDSLKNLKADVGFIACNTAHHFFDLFQTLVNFKLVSMIDVHLPEGATAFCSPTSKELGIFGEAKPLSKALTKRIENIIVSINDDCLVKPGTLSDIVRDSGTENPVFCCTEISLQAFNEGLKGVDTLELALSKVVQGI
ncbi:aspartate/glutamate racemase family protein [Candidatus Saccharibacteria bacterium]|nr:aspartate/glutamate racemase family protein [Candidatus Saccharibacteria bacterium]